MEFKNKNNVLYIENGSKYLKIAGFDLDHTLIKSKNGKVHPKDKEDYELCFPNIKEKLKKLNENKYRIVIFTNQSSMDKEEKKELILSRILNYVKEMGVEIPIDIYISCKGDHCRKPNTGMWDFCMRDLEIDIKNSFFVGDAGGRNINPQTRKKDFSCSDRMFASNVGIKFYTPEKYFQPNIYKNKEVFVMPKLWTTFEKTQPKLDIKDIGDCEVVILIGAPGSGKSTISNTLIDFKLVSQDILKYKSKCLKTMDSLLKKGEKVLIDNTNPKRDKRQEYIDIAKKHKKKICAITINITKEQSMFLVNYRCKKNKSIKIPDVAIHLFYKNFEKPIKGEGFETIINRTFVPNLLKQDKVIFEQYF